jgi:hypothetical protein
MNRKEEIATVQSMLEGILPGSRLMGTGYTTTCPETNKKVPENQIFPSEQRHHQLPSGLGDPVKTESPDSTSGLRIPDRGRVFRIDQRNRQGFYIWKMNLGYTYCADGKLQAEFILKQ